ncbi:hypothetical protein FBQ96_10445 [Nitrospirales bacterium NOB]|nr:MAG: hypothetical protein UZ03_NOB001002513 [Nitrospira sp. OLB3]MBV6469239.1 hypothetical protein [Nitrospirota bacterium]MCE7964796.1 hypothetical protein [Nitrospira sp. NTP2]MCK6492546.1 hypothetical protein [Nitrospira sp.]MDL1889981.1 hypothetical protein [Nitrospirales bacterium NOB]MEB2337784.1 hypothetical protein [Nitrospirales bacterium]
MKRDTWLYVAVVTGGIVLWAFISVFSHKSEAWDSDLYFTLGLPMVCVLSAVLGYLEPNKPWRWGAAPLAGQGVWMLITQGPGNLFPLGIVMFGILALPSILTAKIGASVAAKGAVEA